MKEPDRQALLHALGRPELRQNEIRKPRQSWFRLGLGLGLLGVGFLAALLAVQLFGKTGRPASVTTAHSAPFSPLPNSPQFWPQPTPSPPGLSLARETQPVQRAADVLSQPQSTPSPALAPVPTPTPKAGLVAGPPVALSPTVRYWEPVLSSTVAAPAEPAAAPVSQPAVVDPLPTATPTATPTPTLTPTPLPTATSTPTPTAVPTLTPTPRPTTTSTPTPSTKPPKGENKHG